MKGSTKGLLIGGGIALFLLFLYKGSKIVAQYVVRNLKNNNPGNLRITSIPWEGKVPLSENTDGSFEQFQETKDPQTETIEPGEFWGLRAAGINALSKYAQGYQTLYLLGNQWAPPSDNAGADDYGAKLASQLGVDKDAVYDVPSNLGALVSAITINEGGIDPYSDSLRARAANSALLEKGYL